jgi:predicted DNA binding CopG/RHH family protein
MAKRRKSTDEQLLESYESGKLVSTGPSKAELKKYRDSARATLIKDRRVNIRLSSPVLLDIQARAAEDGIPYQTLIASVLHKFVTGRLVEKPSRHKSLLEGLARGERAIDEGRTVSHAEAKRRMSRWPK